MLEQLPTKRELYYGSKKIEYLHYRMDRKTIEVAVNPDCSITVKSPLEVEGEYLEYRVRKRARWIIRQRNYFMQFQPRETVRYYISGETHLYLGKKYRLQVEEGSEVGVWLKDGRFLVRTPKGANSSSACRAMEAWYRKKAGKCFTEILTTHWELFKNTNDSKPKLTIRSMKTRWGSLSEKGILTLNVNLIKAPRECIEYVMIHELCHLQHPDHSAKFYALLESKLPDWERRKHKLELCLA